MAQSEVRTRIRSIANAPLPPAPNFDLSDLRLEVEYLDPGDLKAPRRQTRKHSDRGLKALQASINEHGFVVPILIDAQRNIIAGHGRWLAAKKSGLKQIPTIEASHLTPEQRRIFALADNKLASLSEWDLEELKVELSELTELDLKMELNLELTGFTTTEIDTLLLPRAPKDEGESEGEELCASAVTLPGDLWQLGNHRLICGSALEADTFERLMGNDRAQMVFSDPPYNVPASMISGLGKRKHSDFKMASGEMSPAEFTSFLTTSFDLLSRFSVDGSIHFQCMDWRHMGEMLAAGQSAYSELKNLVVWKKHSGGMGTFYRSQHELVFVWKHGTAPHINNFGLGETGRYRTNVWEYHGNNGFHKERDAELAAHATVKPWSMVADAIRDCSKRGGIIVDPFGGSGTTLIAAEHTGRKARLIELDPRYCDVIIRRWQKVTGQEAIQIETGESFEEVAEQRGFGDGEEFGCDEADA